MRHTQPSKTLRCNGRRLYTATTKRATTLPPPAPIALKNHHRTSAHSTGGRSTDLPQGARGFNVASKVTVAGCPSAACTASDPGDRSSLARSESSLGSLSFSLQWTRESLREFRCRWRCG
ncbi:MAG: hypothetical protein KME47_16085 [Nodosilinea sp. WJT8-NPBG4]|nr:hypothetical protein [Nodosilinea sp. WJT8-NPBG4]